MKDRAGEFLAIHKLTHEIGANDMMNLEIKSSSTI